MARPLPGEVAMSEPLPGHIGPSPDSAAPDARPVGPAASDVSVTVRDGVVRREGIVAAAAVQESTVDAVDGVPGVEEIRDALVVRTPGVEPGQQAEPQGPGERCRRVTRSDGRYPRTRARARPPR
jgi:hypothetical protein